MNGKQLISREIEMFYNKASEETRLEKGMGVFEFTRIKSLIEKYINKERSTIIDIGGGTGKYAEWLAKKGHCVSLIEPIEKHIRIAQDRAQTLKNKFTIYQAEACHLPLKNNTADLIILHGPLYHLQKAEDRKKAISEAKRVLKKGGVILAFAINYTASTLVALLQGLLHKNSFFEMCKEELTSGIHNAPEDFPWLLPEAYYHRPSELKLEFIQQELFYINTYAVESFVWLDKNYFASMTSSKKRKKLEELIQITENDSELLAFSPHMMIAVQKK